jgi:NADH:ubiquinone reductase (H+-translocating)
VGRLGLRGAFELFGATYRRRLIRTRILLIGCSFAGLEFLYRSVRRSGRFRDGEIIVVDPRREHMYIPLLHEVTSATLQPRTLEFDVAEFCRAVGAGFIAASAVAHAPARRTVALHDGTQIEYDRLIVAVGSVPAVPSGMTGREDVFAPKWLPDALRLRSRLLALRTDSTSEFDVAVIGAGVTGIEWSAELASVAFAGRRARVTIVGKEARLLPGFDDRVVAHATRVLDRLGVRTILGRGVVSLDAGRLRLDDGTTVRADAVVWAGGLRPAPALGDFGLPLTETGHLAVTSRLAVAGFEGVYGMGDAVRIVQDGSVWPTMERAIEAIWQGALLARRLAGEWKDSDGPAHRLRRDFPYGISLGAGNSMVVYGSRWGDAPVLASFRRWLKWAYYVRYRALAALPGRGRLVRPATRQCAELDGP